MSLVPWYGKSQACSDLKAIEGQFSTKGKEEKRGLFVVLQGFGVLFGLCLE